jgi:hypothetical protein
LPTFKTVIALPPHFTRKFDQKISKVSDDMGKLAMQLNEIKQMLMRIDDSSRPKRGLEAIE